MTQHSFAPFSTETILEISEMEREEIGDLLYQLGITTKYVGYDYLSYAIHLCMHQPERLCLVTKWLYPDVAEHFQIDWKTVERGMRFANNIAWSTRSEKLRCIAQGRLIEKPCAAQFIGIIVGYLGF